MKSLNSMPVNVCVRFFYLMDIIFVFLLKNMKNWCILVYNFKIYASL